MLHYPATGGLRRAASGRLVECDLGGATRCANRQEAKIVASGASEGAVDKVVHKAGKELPGKYRN
jgi:hypothetical protein